jgi:hypothetical protein
MRPFIKYRSGLAAVVILIATIFIGGCKKTADVKTEPSTAKEPNHRQALTGQVECNGETLSFGYVVFLGSPRGHLASAPGILNYEWAEISENGSYYAARVPEGDVSIKVITDPEALSKLINQYAEQNEVLQRFGKPSVIPGSVARGSRDRPRGSLPPNAIGRSGGPPPEEGPDPGSDPANGSGPPRRSSHGTRLTGARNPPHGMGSDASLPPNMPNGVPQELARLMRTVGKGKETFDGLPPETRDLLAKINEKYGAGSKSGLHESIAQGQKTLDIKLKID